MAELEKWPGVHSVIAVETIRTAHSRAKVTSNYRFCLSSLTRSAADFAALIRQHWHIENKLHWSLDVTFNEDRCRIRKDPCCGEHGCLAAFGVESIAAGALQNPQRQAETAPLQPQ